jgi:hypothetical protein
MATVVVVVHFSQPHGVSFILDSTRGGVDLALLVGIVPGSAQCIIPMSARRVIMEPGAKVIARRLAGTRSGVGLPIFGGLAQCTVQTHPTKHNSGR